MAVIFDKHQCTLGEGALWHPLIKQLFWFDILEKRMFSKKNGKLIKWHFNEYVSAAGWLDEQHLLIASERRLFSFNIKSYRMADICDLEASTVETRSNDGRADPWGGFWISTMGKRAEKGAGSIYRYFNGQLNKIHDGLTIPNSICFALDKSCVYFSDTSRHLIFKQTLAAADGVPCGPVQVFADFSSEKLNPDGAVLDSKGNIWCAFWGSSKLLCLTETGGIKRSIELPVLQPTCPAFGGDDYGCLYITSACDGIGEGSVVDGQTLSIEVDHFGLAEYRVTL